MDSVRSGMPSSIGSSSKPARVDEPRTTPVSLRAEVQAKVEANELTSYAAQPKDTLWGIWSSQGKSVSWEAFRALNAHLPGDVLQPRDVVALPKPGWVATTSSRRATTPVPTPVTQAAPKEQVAKELASAFANTVQGLRGEAKALVHGHDSHALQALLTRANSASNALQASATAQLGAGAADFLKTQPTLGQLRSELTELAKPAGLAAQVKELGRSLASDATQNIDQLAAQQKEAAKGGALMATLGAAGELVGRAAHGVEWAAGQVLTAVGTVAERPEVLGEQLSSLSNLGAHDVKALGQALAHDATSNLERLSNEQKAVGKESALAAGLAGAGGFMGKAVHGVEWLAGQALTVAGSVAERPAVVGEQLSKLAHVSASDVVTGAQDLAQGIGDSLSEAWQTRGATGVLVEAGLNVATLGLGASKLGGLSKAAGTTKAATASRASEVAVVAGEARAPVVVAPGARPAQVAERLALEHKPAVLAEAKAPEAAQASVAQGAPASAAKSAPAASVTTRDGALEWLQSKSTLPGASTERTEVFRALGYTRSNTATSTVYTNASNGTVVKLPLGDAALSAADREKLLSSVKLGRNYAHPAVPALTRAEAVNSIEQNLTKVFAGEHEEAFRSLGFVQSREGQNVVYTNAATGKKIRLPEHSRGMQWTEGDTRDLLGSLRGERNFAHPAAAFVSKEEALADLEQNLATLKPAKPGLGFDSNDPALMFTADQQFNLESLGYRHTQLNGIATFTKNDSVIQLPLTHPSSLGTEAEKQAFMKAVRTGTDYVDASVKQGALKSLEQRLMVDLPTQRATLQSLGFKEQQSGLFTNTQGARVHLPTGHRALEWPPGEAQKLKQVIENGGTYVHPQVTPGTFTSARVPGVPVPVPTYNAAPGLSLNDALKAVSNERPKGTTYLTGTAANDALPAGMRVGFEPSTQTLRVVAETPESIRGLATRASSLAKEHGVPVRVEVPGTQTSVTFKGLAPEGTPVGVFHDSNTATIHNPAVYLRNMKSAATTLGAELRADEQVAGLSGVAVRPNGDIAVLSTGQASVPETVESIRALSKNTPGVVSFEHAGGPSRFVNGEVVADDAATLATLLKKFEPTGTLKTGTLQRGTNATFYTPAQPESAADTLRALAKARPQQKTYLSNSALNTTMPGFEIAFDESKNVLITTAPKGADLSRVAKNAWALLLDTGKTVKVDVGQGELLSFARDLTGRPMFHYERALAAAAKPGQYVKDLFAAGKKTGTPWLKSTQTLASGEKVGLTVDCDSRLVTLEAPASSLVSEASRQALVEAVGGPGSWAQFDAQSGTLRFSLR